MRQWVIIAIVMALCSLSLVMLRSIAPDLLTKQLLALLLGVSIWLLLFRMDFNFWQKFSLIGYIGLVGLLVWLLVIGTSTRGTVGWFELAGGFKFQPSQLSVPLVSLCLLYFFPPHRDKKITPKQAVFWLAMWLFPALAIVLEPDFGSFSVYLLSTAPLLFFYRIPWRWWVGLSTLVVAAAVFAWIFLFQPYQRERVLALVKPQADEEYISVESSARYNSRQALIAVGSGGMFGRGLGYGSQSHLRFLPERQTDFMFAALGEELGFVGATSVLVSYAVLLSVFWWLSLQQTSIARQAFIMTQVAWLFVHCAITIGMNIGLVPITGITLPFLSYGGSSLVSFSLGVGLVLLIDRETDKKLVLSIK